MIIRDRTVTVQINTSLPSLSSKVDIQDVKMDYITVCQVHFLKENYMGNEFLKKWIPGKTLGFFFQFFFFHLRVRVS